MRSASSRSAAKQSTFSTLSRRERAKAATAAIRREKVRSLEYSEGAKAALARRLLARLRSFIELPLPRQKTLASSEERYEKGLAIQAPIYGNEIKDRYTWLPKPFDEAVPRFLTELCFGDFNTRSGLDEKTRELLTVVLLAAMGGAEVQVKSHVEGALKAGNTREEIVCALVHASGYMGIPRLFNALNACRDLLAEE